MERRLKDCVDQGDLFEDVGPDADNRTVVELLRAYVVAVRKELEATGTECTGIGVGRAFRSKHLQGRISVKLRAPRKGRYELVWLQPIGWVLGTRVTTRKAHVYAFMQHTLTPSVEEVVTWAFKALRGRRGHARGRVMRAGDDEALRWQLIAVVDGAR